MMKYDLQEKEIVVLKNDNDSNCIRLYEIVSKDGDSVSVKVVSEKPKNEEKYKGFESEMGKIRGPFSQELFKPFM